ncbi:MAG: glycosyltransferase family 1 protein [Deltaproteobacteria bacterium]|nr:MAG: glycosyltransferase family 1 protein [Deltaproteobacteria bacterium]
MTHPSRLKILQVIHFYHTGGLEQLALRLGKALKERGHDSHVLALEPGPMRRQFHEAGIQTHSTVRPERFSPRYLLQLAGFIAQHRFDVVHTHHIGPMLYGVPAARLSGSLSVHTTHSMEHLYVPGQPPKGVVVPPSKRKAFQWLAKGCNHIATVDERLQTYLQEDLQITTPVSAILNGIDTSVFNGQHDTSALEKELGFTKDVPWLGVVGRLAPEKGHTFLLQALAQQQQPFRLLVIGDGSLRSSLEEEARSLNLESKVHFLGLRGDLPQLFSTLDLMVLPSLREGLPLVLLEALASGVPVLGSDVGSVARVLNESEAGVVVPPGDVTALQQELEKLLGDSAQLSNKAEKGKAWVHHHYNQTRMVDGYEAVYLSLKQEQSLWKRPLSALQARSASCLRWTPFVGPPATLDWDPRE